MKRRVAITGLGLVSPLGNSVADTWTALLAGRSGAGPITRFDPAALPTVTRYPPRPQASQSRPSQQSRPVVSA